MTPLVVAFGVLALLAIAAEILVSFSARIFGRLLGELSLTGTIVKAQTDIEEVRRKKERLLLALKPVREEYARLNDELREITHEIDRLNRPPEVLVFTVSAGGHRRFRTTLRKQMADASDPQQAVIWRRPCVADVMARDVDAAIVAVLSAFPLDQGYSIGLFDELPQAGQ